eukprot:2735488-Rhodomonas_salina.2
MASEESKTLNQRTGAHGGVPAENAKECGLLFLLPAVVGHLWPPERVVVGLRVCKQLRRDLIAHCASIVLEKKPGARLSDCSISTDLGRLPETLMVTLMLTGRNEVPKLAEVLMECKALVFLDLCGNQFGAEGAGRLAG